MVAPLADRAAPLRPRTWPVIVLLVGIGFCRANGGRLRSELADARRELSIEYNEKKKAIRYMRVEM